MMSFFFFEPRVATNQPGSSLAFWSRNPLGWVKEKSWGMAKHSSWRVILCTQQKSWLAKPEGESKTATAWWRCDTSIKHMPDPTPLGLRWRNYSTEWRTTYAQKRQAAKPGCVRAFAQRSVKSLLSLGTCYCDKPRGSVQCWPTTQICLRVIAEALT